MSLFQKLKKRLPYKHMKKLFLLIGILILTLGCSPEPEIVYKEIIVTATPLPEATPTPLPTLTPVPTAKAKISTPTSISTINPEEEHGVGGLVKNLEIWADAILPQFITASHIKINKISYVSKFRSSAGHDFSDSFETCCSMKHYFIPTDYYGTRFSQPIYSPVDGVVLYLTEPSGGSADDWKIEYEKQTGKETPAEYRDWNIFIRPDNAPNVWVTHMHVNPIDELVETVPATNGIKMMMGKARPAPSGYRVKAGDLIGHGLGEIIIKRHLDGSGIPSPCNDASSRSQGNSPPGCRDKVQLHSIFEFMTDSVFRNYQEIANVVKSDFIVTAGERVKNPLKCNGQSFIVKGNTDDPMTYVKLQDSAPSDNPPSSESIQTDASPVTSITSEALPGFSVLVSGRESIETLDGTGSLILSTFQANEPYILAIAVTGGPITIWVDNGSGERIIYSKPSGNGIATYETTKMDSGQIKVSVKTSENISWQIVAIQSN